MIEVQCKSPKYLKVYEMDCIFCELFISPYVPFASISDASSLWRLNFILWRLVWFESSRMELSSCYPPDVEANEMADRFCFGSFVHRCYKLKGMLGQSTARVCRTPAVLQFQMPHQLTAKYYRHDYVSRRLHYAFGQRKLGQSTAILQTSQEKVLKLAKNMRDQQTFIVCSVSVAISCTCAVRRADGGRLC